MLPASQNSLTMKAHPRGLWENIWAWPFDPHRAIEVAGWGFWLAVLGVLLSVGGFVVTWIQLQQAKSVAEATRDETLRIKKSLEKFDAVQEVTRAHSNIISARNNLSRKMWRECGENCELVIRSISITKKFISDNHEDLIVSCEKLLNYLNKLCERIDRNDMDNIDDDGFAKTKTSLRKNEQTISDILSSLHKDMLNV